MIESARAEPVHREWAARTEQLMLADLSSLGEQHGFSTEAARCGTAQCVFGLRFANAITSEAFDAVLYHGFRVNCARSLVKRTLSDGTPSTDLELLLDCRAGEEL